MAWAHPGQVATIELFAVATNTLLITLAVALANARLLPMTVKIMLPIGPLTSTQLIVRIGAKAAALPAYSLFRHNLIAGAMTSAIVLIPMTLPRVTG